MSCSKAIHLLSSDPVFIDTETTGFGKTREVIQLAIVDRNGEVLLDTLIHPVDPIPGKATAIHGITNRDVEDAPSFLNVWPAIEKTLEGRPIISYNSDFDFRMLWQSAARYKGTAGKMDRFKPNMRCAMHLYSEYIGQRKWVKLSEAAMGCGLDAKPDKLHRAAADAQLMRELVIFMAGEDGEKGL